jgi:hypothetical protein
MYPTQHDHMIVTIYFFIVCLHLLQNIMKPQCVYKILKSRGPPTIYLYLRNHPSQEQHKNIFDHAFHHAFQKLRVTSTNLVIFKHKRISNYTSF